jgi:hypothetical protein
MGAKYSQQSNCQQNLILEKAEQLIASADLDQKERAVRARTLIQKSQDVSALKQDGRRVLYPSDYRIRAEMLVEARHLVGGVMIERL